MNWWKNPIVWMAAILVIAAGSITYLEHARSSSPMPAPRVEVASFPPPPPPLEGELGCVPFLEKRQDGSFTGGVTCIPEPQLLEFCKAVVDRKGPKGAQ